MGHKSYRDLDPLVLYRSDLMDLEALLRAEVLCPACDFFIHAKVSGHELSAKPFGSFSEITEADFPAHLDQLEVNVRRVDADGAVTKSVGLNLDKGSGDIRVYSDTDAQWVAKTRDELESFFRARRPRYAMATKALGPLFNISMVFSLLLFIPVLISGNHGLLVFPAVLFAYALTMFVLGLKRVIFPYVRIALYPKEKEQRRNIEGIVTLAWIIVLAGCVIGSLVMM